jgi:hypothetical protein
MTSSKSLRNQTNTTNTTIAMSSKQTSTTKKQSKRGNKMSFEALRELVGADRSEAIPTNCLDLVSRFRAVLAGYKPFKISKDSDRARRWVEKHPEEPWIENRFEMVFMLTDEPSIPFSGDKRLCTLRLVSGIIASNFAQGFRLGDLGTVSVVTCPIEGEDTPGVPYGKPLVNLTQNNGFWLDIWGEHTSLEDWSNHDKNRGFFNQESCLPTFGKEDVRWMTDKECPRHMEQLTAFQQYDRRKINVLEGAQPVTTQSGSRTKNTPQRCSLGRDIFGSSTQESSFGNPTAAGKPASQGLSRNTMGSAQPTVAIHSSLSRNTFGSAAPTKPAPKTATIGRSIFGSAAPTKPAPKPAATGRSIFGSASTSTTAHMPMPMPIHLSPQQRDQPMVVPTGLFRKGEIFEYALKYPAEKFYVIRIDGRSRIPFLAPVKRYVTAFQDNTHNQMEWCGKESKCIRNREGGEPDMEPWAKSLDLSEGEQVYARLIWNSEAKNYQGAWNVYIVVDALECQHQPTPKEPLTLTPSVPLPRVQIHHEPTKMVDVAVGTDAAFVTTTLRIDDYVRLTSDALEELMTSPDAPIGSKTGIITAIYEEDDKLVAVVHCPIDESITTLFIEAFEEAPKPEPLLGWNAIPAITFGVRTHSNPAPRDLIREQVLHEDFDSLHEVYIPSMANQLYMNELPTIALLIEVREEGIIAAVAHNDRCQHSHILIPHDQMDLFDFHMSSLPQPLALTIDPSAPDIIYEGDEVLTFKGLFDLITHGHSIESINGCAIPQPNHQRLIKAKPISPICCFGETPIYALTSIKSVWICQHCEALNPQKHSFCFECKCKAAEHLTKLVKTCPNPNCRTIQRREGITKCLVCSHTLKIEHMSGGIISDGLPICLHGGLSNLSAVRWLELGRSLNTPYAAILLLNQVAILDTYTFFINEQQFTILCPNTYGTDGRTIRRALTATLREQDVYDVEHQKKLDQSIQLGHEITHRRYLRAQTLRHRY